MLADSLPFFDLSSPLPRSWWGSSPRPPIAANKAQQRKFDKMKQEWHIARKFRAQAKFPGTGKTPNTFDDDDTPIAVLQHIKKANKKARPGNPKKNTTHKRTETEHVAVASVPETIVPPEDQRHDHESDEDDWGDRCENCCEPWDLEPYEIDWEAKGWRNGPCDDCCCGGCGGRKIHCNGC